MFNQKLVQKLFSFIYLLYTLIYLLLLDNYKAEPVGIKNSVHFRKTKKERTERQLLSGELFSMFF